MIWILSRASLWLASPLIFAPILSLHNLPSPSIQSHFWLQDMTVSVSISSFDKNLSQGNPLGFLGVTIFFDFSLSLGCPPHHYGFQFSLHLLSPFPQFDHSCSLPALPHPMSLLFNFLSEIPLSHFEPSLSLGFFGSVYCSIFFLYIRNKIHL